MAFFKSDAILPGVTINKHPLSATIGFARTLDLSEGHLDSNCREFYKLKTARYVVIKNNGQFVLISDADYAHLLEVGIDQYGDIKQVLDIGSIVDDCLSIDDIPVIHLYQSNFDINKDDLLFLYFVICLMNGMAIPVKLLNLQKPKEIMSKGVWFWKNVFDICDLARLDVVSKEDVVSQLNALFSES